jgi:Spy/CpxP family protein refolding chaperone
MERCMSSAKPFCLLPRVICAGLIAFLGLIAATASADRIGVRDERHRAVYAILERFTQALTHVTLTDDQKPQVDKIMKDADQRAYELSRHTEDPTKAEKYDALDAYAHQIHLELSNVLTTGQMETLELYLGQGPSSRPTADDFAGPAMWPNIQKAFAKLDLSPDQRQQVRDLMASSRQKLQALRANADTNGGTIRSQVQQLRLDVKTKLQTILTPDQMQALIDNMRQIRESQSGPTTKPHEKTAAADPQTESNNSDQPDSNSAAAQKSPDVGSPVPDVKIAELNDRAFIPANYKGHVLVLEFGSLSCPVFRDHVQEMEKLRTAEGPRAFFLLVYTREAFPAGDKDVQRNKDQDISVPEATTLQDRKTQAQQTQQQLHITMPVAIDSMDDAVSNAFGTFPNGAVVIGKDGNIAALERWANPESLRRAIDQAYETPAPSNH